MATLNGRIDRLEARLAPAGAPDRCRACGLRHVRPLTIALVRGVLRVAGGSELPSPTVPLCLCDPCCGDPSGRYFARLSYGLPDDEDAA